MRPDVNTEQGVKAREVVESAVPRAAPRTELGSGTHRGQVSAEAGIWGMVPKLVAV